MEELPKANDSENRKESCEKKRELSESKSEEGALIVDSDKQQAWQKAFEAGHIRDQHPSEIEGLPAIESSFGIDFGDGNVVTARSAQSNPSLKDTTIKIGKQEYSSENVLARDWGEILKKGFNRAVQTVKNPELFAIEQPVDGGDSRYPRRGREDEFIDFDACYKANNSFPSLTKYIGEGAFKVDPELIAATIRNEQFYFDNAKDAGPENYAQKHKNWPFDQDESIGPAQMQVRNLKYLAKNYPKQLGLVDDAVSNGINIHHAPTFVAAYFADVIHGIENQIKPAYISESIWKQVNDRWKKGERNEALIIAYNPDPNQINHVFTQLTNIKAPDWD